MQVIRKWEFEASLKKATMASIKNDTLIYLSGFKHI